MNSTLPVKFANYIIGNNAVAVDEAGIEAERRGYSHVMMSSPRCEGEAAAVGRYLAEMAISMRQESGPDCFISGGEPVVTIESPLSANFPHSPKSLNPPTLPMFDMAGHPAKGGRGGRNQELVLAALETVLRHFPNLPIEGSGNNYGSGSGDGNDGVPPLGFGFLSGGTDGEDGPTDAAGALFDDLSLAAMNPRPDLVDVLAHLQRHDSYEFFDRYGGLLRTGPTGTNVCDLRVIVVR